MEAQFAYNLPYEADPTEPEIVVEYSYSRAEKETRTYPGCPEYAEVQIFREGKNITGRRPDEFIQEMVEMALEHAASRREEAHDRAKDAKADQYRERRFSEEWA